jgi:hypothetical protein
MELILLPILAHLVFSLFPTVFAGCLSIAAKNEAILAGEKEPWCGLRDGLLQG